MPARRGQTLVETALILPLFLMVLVGIIVLGIGVFYQQQITNAAREAARYASLHSATARCPTVSNLSPDPALLPLPNSYSDCDRPSAKWPHMTGHARNNVFGMHSGRPAGHRVLVWLLDEGLRRRMGGTRPDPDRSGHRHGKRVPRMHGAGIRVVRGRERRIDRPRDQSPDRASIPPVPDPTRAFGSTAPSRFP